MRPASRSRVRPRVRTRPRRRQQVRRAERRSPRRPLRRRHRLRADAIALAHPSRRTARDRRRVRRCRPGHGCACAARDGARHALPHQFATQSSAVGVSRHRPPRPAARGARAPLETARHTLFLTNLPPSHLPWVYLAIAGLALLIGPLAARPGSERVNRRTLLLMQLAPPAGTAAFLPFIRSPRPLTFYLLYLWGGIAAALILVRFWLMLGDRFTASQAKRLFPIVAAGAVMGSLAGFGTAGLIAAWHDPHALLVASTIVFFASAGAALLWWRERPAVELADRDSGASAPPARETAADRGPGPWQSLLLVARHPYVRRIALLMLLASVAVTLCDFIFKSVAAHAVPQ